MKRPKLSCALTGLCFVLGGLAQGPMIGPCSAPNTTENFNDAYIRRGGLLSTQESTAQAHAVSAPATLTLHSLPDGAFGGGSGAVTFSVIKAERGVLELISCISEGLLHREHRQVLISTTLLRSMMTAGLSLHSAAGDPLNLNVGLREVLRSGSGATASPRQCILLRFS
ncbi:uncharacterized protein LOC125177621 [Hyalella azteca]|uniref:Uncharacterized protein LOC125177621 n=1 Tax=Hyalella azteca TaxID=294128 RepID=A0A979FFH6_HYAAZ|nr:uncharacterized protein LOC125177621 [Hyalella azteca]